MINCNPSSFPLPTKYKGSHLAGQQGRNMHQDVVVSLNKENGYFVLSKFFKIQYNIHSFPFCLPPPPAGNNHLIFSDFTNLEGLLRFCCIELSMETETEDASYLHTVFWCPYYKLVSSFSIRLVVL